MFFVWGGLVVVVFGYHTKAKGCLFVLPHDGFATTASALRHDAPPCIKAGIKAESSRSLPESETKGKERVFSGRHSLCCGEQNNNKTDPRNKQQNEKTKQTYNCFGATSGDMLGSLWGHCGIIWDSRWAHFGVSPAADNNNKQQQQQQQPSVHHQLPADIAPRVVR